MDSELLFGSAVVNGWPQCLVIYNMSLKTPYSSVFSNSGLTDLRGLSFLLEGKAFLKTSCVYPFMTYAAAALGREENELHDVISLYSCSQIPGDCQSIISKKCVFVRLLFPSGPNVGT